MANKFEIVELERLAKENTLQDILLAIKDGKTIEEMESYVKAELEKSRAALTDGQGEAP